MANLTLGQQSYTFDQLEKKYRNFYSPAFEVTIDGHTISVDQNSISRISVEMTVDDKADSFSLTLQDVFDPVKRDFKGIVDLFGLGKYIEIKMGYTDKLDSIFYGIVTSVDYEFSESENPNVAVKGMDITFLMMKGDHSKSWLKKKYSDVVRTIVSQYSSKLEIDATTDVIEEIMQYKTNDYRFLSELADKLDYDFFVVGKTIYFKKALSSKTPVVTLEWGKSLANYSTSASIGSQIADITVRGYDAQKTNYIEAKSKKVSVLGSNSKTGKDIMKTLKKPNQQYVYTNIAAKSEAQNLANALMNRKSMEFVTGSGGCIGLPELKAGRYIKLSGLGKKLNQLMYLTKVTHTIDSNGYKSDFDVGGNAI